MIAQPVMQQWKAWDDKYYNMRTFPPVEVEMNVPSGKIIIDNDIRHCWPEVHDDFDVNETLGLKQTTEAYGHYGMFHGFVGNSCPGVYKDGDFFYIGKQGRSDETDEVIDPLPGEYVGGVITDLWWYCIADLDDYLKRGGKIEKHWAGPNIIDVTPGRYVLKHNHAIGKRKEYDFKTKEVFATFERSDAPLNQWVMPEEPLYRELPRILTEIRHFHHDYKHDTDEFSLLMNVHAGRHKHKPTEWKRDIPWETLYTLRGRLRRVTFPAQLANEGRYDEIAITIKKQMWAEIKDRRRQDKDSRWLKRQRKNMSPEAKKKQDEIMQRILDDLKKELDK